MSLKVKHSLMNRTGITLASIMLLSVINIVISFLTAETAENDAVRINIAGSLRMQSYRIAEAMIIQQDPQLNPEKNDLLTTEIRNFEERFYKPVLIDYLRKASDRELVNTIGKIEEEWLSLKKNLLEDNNSIQEKRKHLQQVDDFVIRIDGLVKKLELQTESKFKLLRSFQVISLLITVTIVALAIIDISSNVVLPLGRIVQMARKVKAGDFTMRLEVEGTDELSLLAQTFNNMAESLNTTYQNLEEKVREKTGYLEKARDEIALLYATSQHLNTSDPFRERIEKTLQQVGHYFSTDNTTVEIIEERGNTIQLAANHAYQPATPPYQYCFTLAHQNHTYGKLTIYFENNRPLSEESSRLLQTIADNIAATFSADRRHEQERRISLMEERAVIARELHDSLAQSLSYLKIQISRLQMQQQKGNNPEAQNDTIDHIKTGISTAYTQLRELLTTFRLKLPSGGLHAALVQTAEEFSHRSDIDIALEYQLANFPLTPNEEIHILQIIREALSNVSHHSRATHARVILSIDADCKIHILVKDNGIGFEEGDIKAHHYGKTIIRERAKTLGGDISFISPPEGGAEVRMTFIPAATKNKKHEITTNGATA